MAGKKPPKEKILEKTWVLILTAFVSVIASTLALIEFYDKLPVTPENIVPIVKIIIMLIILIVVAIIILIVKREK